MMQGYNRQTGFISEQLEEMRDDSFSSRSGRRPWQTQSENSAAAPREPIK